MSFRSVIFKVIAGIAIAAAVGVTVFFIYTVNLRNEYKDTALEINKAVALYRDSTVVRQGSVSTPVSAEIPEFFDRFLLDVGTVVFSRDQAEPDERTIELQLGDKTLAFTGLEDGSAIHVLWTDSGTSKSFRVRSVTSFMQLDAYLQNYFRRNKE